MGEPLNTSSEKTNKSHNIHSKFNKEQSIKRILTNPTMYTA
jgi:uncharacterized membrane protein